MAYFDPVSDRGNIILKPARPDGAFGDAIRAVGSLIALVVGGVLILVGIPLAVITPFPFIPIGGVVVVSGLAIIARNSRTARAFVYRFLRRHRALSERIPSWLLRLLFGPSPGTFPENEHRTKHRR